MGIMARKDWLLEMAMLSGSSLVALSSTPPKGFYIQSWEEVISWARCRPLKFQLPLHLTLLTVLSGVTAASQKTGQHLYLDS